MKRKLIEIANKFLYPLVKLFFFVFRPTFEGSGCIVVSDGQLLFIKHTYGDLSWSLPGGRMEKGESPEETAIRELKEEVGIEADDPEELGTMEMTIVYADRIIHCFLFRVDQEAFPNSTEIKKTRWFDFDDLPEDINVWAKAAIENYEGEIKS